MKSLKAQPLTVYYSINGVNQKKHVKFFFYKFNVILCRTKRNLSLWKIVSFPPVIFFSKTAIPFYKRCLPFINGLFAQYFNVSELFIAIKQKSFCIHALLSTFFYIFVELRLTQKSKTTEQNYAQGRIWLPVYCGKV